MLSVNFVLYCMLVREHLRKRRKKRTRDQKTDPEDCLVDGLAVKALIRLLVEGGGAIPIAADEPVSAQRAVEAVHILLVTLRTVLAEILNQLPKIPTPELEITKNKNP
jgi:hypothetical protein